MPQWRLRVARVLFQRRWNLTGRFTGDQSNTVTTGSVSCGGGDCIQTGITADGSISCGGGGCPQTGSTAKGGITCPDDPCAKCGEGGMTGRPRAFYSPPGQPPIPVPNCVWKSKFYVARLTG